MVPITVPTTRMLQIAICCFSSFSKESRKPNARAKAMKQQVMMFS